VKVFNEGMNFKSTRFGIIFGLIVTCTALAVAGFWMGNVLNTKIPSDKTLLTVFHDHRDAFEKLQRMATSDVRRGWYLGISEKSKLDKPRLHEYNDLVSEIGANVDVTMDGYDNGMRFIFASGGGPLVVNPGWGQRNRIHT
jgi:hypothetical protein